MIPYNPIAGGMLTGKHARGAPDRGDTVHPRVRVADVPGPLLARGEFETVDALRPLAAEAVSLTPLAVAWVLAHPAVTSPIIGASRPEQLDDSLAAVEKDLDPALGGPARRADPRVPSGRRLPVVAMPWRSGPSRRCASARTARADLGRLNAESWPHFLRQRDEFGLDRLWGQLYTRWADFQFVLRDGSGGGGGRWADPAVRLGRDPGRSARHHGRAHRARGGRPRRRAVAEHAVGDGGARRPGPARPGAQHRDPPGHARDRRRARPRRAGRAGAAPAQGQLSAGAHGSLRRSGGGPMARCSTRGCACTSGSAPRWCGSRRGRS